MNIYTKIFVALILFSQASIADDLAKDAAIGGAIGGALGGVIGAEAGGREGAILGSGMGAAVGTAITTKEHSKADRNKSVHYEHGVYSQIGGHPHAYHCPPGQAKKGRC